MTTAAIVLFLRWLAARLAPSAPEGVAAGFAAGLTAGLGLALMIRGTTPR